MPDPPTRRRWFLVAAAVAAVLAIVVVLVIALSGDDDEPVATSDTTSTSTTVEPTSTAPDTTTATTVATTVAPTTAPPVVDGEIAARGDLDGDGLDELFVRAPGGAYTDMIELFTLTTGGEAVPVTLAGAPAAFPVGASVRNVAGLRCDLEHHAVVVYAGESHDGEEFEVSWRELRLEHGALTEAGTGHGAAHDGDHLHTVASTLDCTDL